MPHRNMQRTKSLVAKRATTSKDEIFQAVCEDCAEGVDADRTSVWTFDRDLTQIECQCCYDALEKTFTKGAVLKRDDFPTYFKAIVEDNIVNAPHARTQQATREFTEPYFVPNGIHSLLDFILQKDLVPIGIICCENRRGIRDWDKSNEEYLRTIATLTSFLFS
ncbi:GAF domain-containing protein [Pelagicoccus sp. SDUM812005]|uniref:GAF domain-containing protein n=1 Tax=Pelagicoccus sp. SDUM812005 TaxID=3041257 RepID=UPI00280FC12F|nr:GAF domain-containing protein [Pelagicoccus sp. SDUM812005]MDQ8180486.1 GAF domain-containing protein [Pelagicoccus sp. SDUM812005]